VLTKSEDGQQVGYLSSDRIGGQGADDIYSFAYVKPKAKVSIEGLTRDKATGNLLPVSTVTLFADVNTLSAKGETDSAATILFAANENTTYKVLGEKQGYHADSLNITIPHIE